MGVPPSRTVPDAELSPADADAKSTSGRRKHFLAVLGSALGLVVLAVLVLRSNGTTRTAASGGVADRGAGTDPAPPFMLPALTNPKQSVSLDTFRGQPVVVNFWAAWCVPCRKEMPRLAAAARRLAGRVAFVGVDYEDVRADALALVRASHVTYPSGVDEDGSVGRLYGIFGLPVTVFVDNNGRIVARHLGEMTTSTLDGLLRNLTGTAAPG